MLIIPISPHTAIHPASISFDSKGFSNIRQSGDLSIARHLLPGFALFDPGSTEFFYLLVD